MIFKHVKALLPQKIWKSVKQVLVLIMIFSIFFVFASNDAFGEGALDRISVNAPRLVNPFGEPVSEHVNINQNVQIAADIVNNQNVSQPFVYIVQVKNSNNVILAISWISGSLEPQQSFSPALSWTPQSTDTYKAEIYVWKSIAEPEALAQQSTINIISS